MYRLWIVEYNQGTLITIFSNVLIPIVPATGIKPMYEFKVSVPLQVKLYRKNSRYEPYLVPPDPHSRAFTFASVELKSSVESRDVAFSSE